MHLHTTFTSYFQGSTFSLPWVKYLKKRPIFKNPHFWTATRIIIFIIVVIIVIKLMFTNLKKIGNNKTKNSMFFVMWPLFLGLIEQSKKCKEISEETRNLSNAAVTGQNLALYSFSKATRLKLYFPTHTLLLFRVFTRLSVHAILQSASFNWQEKAR